MWTLCISYYTSAEIAELAHKAGFRDSLPVSAEPRADGSACSSDPEWTLVRAVALSTRSDLTEAIQTSVTQEVLRTGTHSGCHIARVGKRTGAEGEAPATDAT
jgi:hypothetical protein